MLRSAVDQQRLQRRKKIPRRIAGTSLSGLIAAEFSAQGGQELFGAGQFGAAGFQPLELGQKTAARQRRQLLQIFLNPIGLYHCSVIFRSLNDRPLARTRGHSEEHTSELQSHSELKCPLPLKKKK